ncbi:aminotransferase class V-fold PLP-dependent enzyme [Chitinasiproducens palmae]|uniref:Selenocysteine lyase/Cysteine desulfurase n=1 Tax=Chitinasiproducens palmae TaxID=1770053 RepID=A0A1H2PM56_9BURK|nr:aminotransferase class V-fold PLP-dependent enzyme [Chitinasiproducens palmae]SDV47606.1 Selenocysteine lyase/Cysteine desulfurase [Chitinasiproducens palmae]
MPATRATALAAPHLDRLRADTPALRSSGHFNHGSCSLPPAPVFDAARHWLDLEARHGTLAALERLGDALIDSRQAMAALLHTQAARIAFTPSASHGWALASRALCAHGGAHIITTRHEWGGNALVMFAERDAGRLVIHRLDAASTEPADPLDRLDSAIAALPPSLRRSTAAPRWALSVQAVSAGFGGVADFTGLAERVHAAGGLLFVDASHAVGQTDVDVHAIDCDVLVFPTRKWLRGPKGVGVLYLSERALAAFDNAPLPDASNTEWRHAETAHPRTDARRFEIGEFNPGLRLAAGAAARYATELGPAAIEATVHRVAASLAEQIAARTGLQPAEVALLAGTGPMPCRDDGVAMRSASGLLTYRLPAGAAGCIAARLHARGLRVGTVEPANLRWLFTSLGAVDLLRLTPHYMTPTEQCAALVDALADALAAVLDDAVAAVVSGVPRQRSHGSGHG